MKEKERDREGGREMKDELKINKNLKYQLYKILKQLVADKQRSRDQINTWHQSLKLRDKMF